MIFCFNSDKVWYLHSASRRPLTLSSESVIRHSQRVDLMQPNLTQQQHTPQLRAADQSWLREDERITWHRNAIHAALCLKIICSWKGLLSGCSWGEWYSVRWECSVIESHEGCGGMRWTLLVENSSGCTEDRVSSGVDSETKGNIMT